MGAAILLVVLAIYLPVTVSPGLFIVMPGVPVYAWRRRHRAEPATVEGRPS